MNNTELKIDDWEITDMLYLYKRLFILYPEQSDFFRE